MAAAEIRPDWTVGTLTLVGGSKDFTTTGSALETAAIQAGDEIITQSGLTLIIATITGQNSGTLMEDCPAGAAGVDQPLRIRFQPDGSRYNGATADLVQLLGSGNVYAFAGLNGSADKLPMFSGAGTLTIIDKADLVSGVKFNALVDTLADRDAYDNEAAGFVVMVADVGDGRSAVYFKNSVSPSDWSDAAYVTGPAGGLSSIEVGTTATLPAGSNATVVNSGTSTEPILDFGIPAGSGFYSKGDYASASQYNVGDVVQYNGSSFVATVATQGNPPPAPPATSNAYWNLLAKMGEGGDMFKAVYDPTNQNRDIFAAIADKTSMYDSVAVASSSNIPANISAVILSGYYAAGDGGIALYKRVSAEPVHIGKFQSADGAWWEYADDHVNVRAFGARGDGAADDTNAINGAFSFAYLKATQYQGSLRVYFPKGFYLVDTIRYSPTEYIPIKIHGDGKSSTFIRRRLASQAGNIFEIGNDPSTTYRGEIEISDMTIDGYDGTANGLALYEVWYSILRNVRISNCNVGLVGAAAIYIDAYSVDITWNKIGVDINTFPNASFPGTNPAVVNFFGGIIWRNSQCGINADYFNSINTYGTGFEKNGTNNTATEGAIVTGTHVDRNGMSTGVTMFGGWVEDNKGLSQLSFSSGFNSIKNVRFWQPDGISTYAIRFIAGKYSVSECTITSGSTTIIKEESGVSVGNKISLCNGFAYEVDSAKTSVDEGASVRHAYISVGGANMTSPSLVIQNNQTFFQFVMEGGQLKLKQGNTELDSWG